MMQLKVKCRFITICFILMGIVVGCTHGKGTANPHHVDDPSLSQTTLSPQGDDEKLSSGYDSGNSRETDSAPESDDDDFFDEDEFFDEDVEPDEEESLVADPLYYWNYAMFQFNDKLYFWCLKPVAQGYIIITPDFFRKGVRNFFYNLSTPIRFVNSVLQWKIGGAGAEIGRFAVNTTVGFAGVWDPAEKYLDLKPSEEDLGQTLGRYGVGNGFYIVWPFVGPSTLRDSLGKGGDAFLSPLYYVEPFELRWGLWAFDNMNSVSFRIGDYESVKAASLNPYVMVRDFYIEYRKKRVAE